mmetsp:Transcript_36969/g.92410  ORF Transcript_36969/g.92410 Transcript_36969/m.92410 type:complete len:204 (-) Transcript_36969:63-674(-)
MHMRTPLKPYFGGPFFSLVERSLGARAGTPRPSASQFHAVEGRYSRRRRLSKRHKHAIQKRSTECRMLRGRQPCVATVFQTRGHWRRRSTQRGIKRTQPRASSRRIWCGPRWYRERIRRCQIRTAVVAIRHDADLCLKVERHLGLGFQLGLERSVSRLELLVGPSARVQASGNHRLDWRADSGRIGRSHRRCGASTGGGSGQR